MSAEILHMLRGAIHIVMRLGCCQKRHIIGYALCWVVGGQRRVGHRGTTGPNGHRPAVSLGQGGGDSWRCQGNHTHQYPSCGHDTIHLTSTLHKLSCQSIALTTIPPVRTQANMRTDEEAQSRLEMLHNARLTWTATLQAILHLKLSMQ